MKIEVRDAVKRFGRVEALKGVSFEVPRGRRVALVGPNGSGKSTLIRALLGLIECQGSVRLDGRSPYESRIETARQLAYVPQVAPALGASAHELVDLVCLTRNLPRRDVERAAAALSLDLSELARRPFRSLSGGMKQKLLLALAFAARPTLMVMDEPTASLDESTRRRFFELCAGLEPQTTLVLCSHRLEEVSRLTDHVLALDDGRLRFDGPLELFRAWRDTPAGSAVPAAGPPPRPALTPARAGSQP
jgi:ABC-2 type transport system ATP-binding protein